MKIILKNKTRYRDDDLRAIIRGACSVAGVGFGTVRVTIASARRDSVSGFAYFPPKVPRALLGTRTGDMTLCIPVPGTVIRRGSVAQVALHEAMHLAGAHHRDMTEEQLHCRMATPWADQLPLREREPAPAVPREERVAAARAGRLEHARTMLARASTRLKRATTIEKKWARRVKMLER